MEIKFYRVPILTLPYIRLNSNCETEGKKVDVWKRIDPEFYELANYFRFKSKSKTAGYLHDKEKSKKLRSIMNEMNIPSYILLTEECNDNDSTYAIVHENSSAFSFQIERSVIQPCQISEIDMVKYSHFITEAQVKMTSKLFYNIRQNPPAAAIIPFPKVKRYYK